MQRISMEIGSGLVVGTLTANIKSIKNGDNFCEFMWKGTVSGVVGGAVGAATAATGGAAAAHFGATGFIAGAATGAATGAVGGALGGASNAWLNGANFRDGFMAGVKGGLIGAASGAVLGGISGGIDAFIHNKNVWTGDEVAMGRSQFAFSNTDKGVEAYQTSQSKYAVKNRYAEYNSTKSSVSEKYYKESINNPISSESSITNRTISMDPKQIGPIDISMSGSVPQNCSYKIYADGKLLKTIEQGYYKNALTLRVFNIKSIYIEMVGPINSSNEIVVRPMFNTVIKTMLKW